MQQIDITAPKISINASRKERFEESVEIVGPDEITAVNLSNLTIKADLILDQYVKLSLSENNGLTRLASNVIKINISTTQMNNLSAARYRLELYTQSGMEREDLIHFLLTIE